MIYDIAIIGSGPAGINSAIYSARYMMKTLIIGQIAGGMPVEAHEIRNFLTYSSIKGYELAKKMREHLESLNLKLNQEKVINITKSKSLFTIKTEKNSYQAKKLVIASGTSKRKLNLKNEGKFHGKGISYCATCDSPFFKNKIVAVVGGGNSALTSALLLSEFAEKVYIIYRRENFFRAEPAWVKAVEENKKIETLFNEDVAELMGEDKLKFIKLKNRELKVDGLFIEIGTEANTEFVKSLDLKMENGFIEVDKLQRTSKDSVFAAGDVANNSLKQIITAAAEGAIAATTAYQELVKEK